MSAEGTEEQHRAWLDGLTPAERAITMVPLGHRWSMLSIALTKHVLQQAGLKDAERLKMLEDLNGTIDLYLSQQMLARIDPMSDTEAKMVDEAMALDRAGKRCKAAYDVLTGHDTFKLFVGLNKGMLAAIRMREAAA